MKTKFLTLILSAILFFLASCQTGIPNETEEPQSDEQTTVNENLSEESNETNIDDSQYVLIRQIGYDANGNQIFRYEFTYDELGNIKCEQYYSYNELITRTDNTYNLDQQLIQTVYTDFYSGSAQSYIYDYEYDTNGNVTVKQITDISGNLTIHTYEYDDSGKLLKVSNSNNASQTIYTYPDENTCIILTESQQGGSTTFFQTQETYDNNRNLICQTVYQQNSYENIEYELIYTYNEYKLQLTSEIYMDGTLNGGTYNEYACGCLIRATHQDANGIYLIEEYEYDQYGNLIKNVSKMPSGLTMQYVVYEYDIIN